MRSVVLVDLVSTVMQPVTLAYIIYLIVLVVRGSTIIPLTAFVLLGATYGLQAVVFIPASQVGNDRVGDHLPCRRSDFQLRTPTICVLVYG